jgi:hypothetical protein
VTGINRTLTLGSTGPDVVILQNRLNTARPTLLLLLKPDGAFGQKTLARVKEFQRNNGLKEDGIVGPETLAKLEPAPPPNVRLRRCGNGDPANRARGLALQNAFAGSRSGASAFSAPSISLKPLKGSGREEGIATRVFGTSLQLETIFMSDATGLQNRPFTTAVPAQTLPVGAITGVVQVMNLGTFTPDEDDLIHELAHVWQSQHHSDKFQFMKNCVSSQGAALAANPPKAIFDPSIARNEEFPSNFPVSAYAFVRGKAFDQYAGEQIAQQVERNVTAIRARMKGIGAGVVDSANVTSLSQIRTEDRRSSSVEI